jgi:hypothetical protein
MTAESIVLPGEDPERLTARAAAWKEELQPEGELQDYLVGRAVHAAWQLDRCDRAIAARLELLVQFGDFDRDEAERDEAEDLARRLFWDPRGPITLYPHFRGFRYTPRISSPETVDDPLNPARIVNHLEATHAGSEWLLERWADLRRLLEEGLNWQAPDRLRAIRLPGRQPMDALADERVLSIYLACDAMAPGSPTSIDDLLTETTDAELAIFKARAQGRGADGKKPASPEAGRAALRALVERALARLAGLLADHRERRAFEKAVNADLMAFDRSREGELMRRYQLAKARELQRTIASYDKVQRDERSRDQASMLDEPEVRAVPITTGPREAVLQVNGPPSDDITNLKPETCAALPSVLLAPPDLVPAPLLGDETNPNPPQGPGRETNPNPPEATPAMAAEPVRAAIPSARPDRQAVVTPRPEQPGQSATPIRGASGESGRWPTS